MLCPNCNGKGKLTMFDGLRGCFRDVTCVSCNGKCEIEQTNEEWFCTLSTNDKAEAIAHLLSTDEIEYTSIHFRVWRWLEKVHKESE